MKTFKDKMAEKFQRATKTDLHYTGMINGKTYVVPHSFEGDKKAAIRYAIVTSPTHVQHNNPTLKPEEVARVHQHIKDIHEEYDYPDPGPGPSKKKKPMKDSEIKARIEAINKQQWKIESAKNPFMKEDRQLALHLGLTRHDKKEVPKPKVVKAQAPKPAVSKREEDPAAYQAARDTYRHAALAASRRAATLAFAKKHHIINEDPMKKPNYTDPFAHHQTVIAKKTLRMPDAMVGVMGGPNKDESRKHLKKIGWTDEQIHKHEHGQFVMHEHVWSVTDHMGHTHEVEAKDHDEAKKKTVSVGGVHPQGIPMTQWHKVKVQRKNLEERTLTPSETEKKEELVHKMKPKLQSFNDRYGKEGKSVLYAVATKQAKKLAEEPEQLDELSDAAKQFIHHRENYWKLAKGHSKANPYGPTQTQRQQMNVHSKEMDKHHKAMTPAERHVAHTGSYVSPASKRLQGGSAKGDKEYVHEHSEPMKSAIAYHSKNFMATYHRNENANRHTANIVHLAKHFGDAADQAQAKFYHDELKKHGHNIHHEAQYELHKKLWPKAMAAHKLTEGTETMSTKQTVRRVLSEMSTRKHFQQVADVIKAHPDAAKRRELAAHHAGIFKAQNPRFDHKRFYAAANAGEPGI